MFYVAVDIVDPKAWKLETQDTLGGHSAEWFRAPGSKGRNLSQTRTLGLET